MTPPRSSVRGHVERRPDGLIQVSGPAVVQGPAGEYEVATPDITLKFAAESEVWLKVWPEPPRTSDVAIDPLVLADLMEAGNRIAQLLDEAVSPGTYPGDAAAEAIRRWEDMLFAAGRDWR